MYVIGHPAKERKLGWRTEEARKETVEEEQVKQGGRKGERRTQKANTVTDAQRVIVGWRIAIAEDWRGNRACRMSY